MGGEPLWPGQVVNVYVGREGALLGVVIRVDKSVERVVLQGGGGERFDVPLFPTSLVEEIKVGGAFLDGLGPYEMLAMNADGELISRQDLPVPQE
jgi:hypothetical protein